MDQILQILIQNGYIDEAAAKDLADLSKTESKPVRQLVIDQLSTPSASSSVTRRSNGGSDAAGPAGVYCRMSEKR